MAKSEISKQNDSADSSREALLEEDGAATRKFKQVLVEIFGRFDIDKDGVLSHAELRVFSGVANEGREFTDEELEELEEFFDWKEGPEGGLTLRGWMDMYLTQTSSREDDTWEDLIRLGYTDKLELLTTKGAALTARLKELVELGRAGDLDAFVNAFVTPDVDADDRAFFLGNLRGSGEEEPQLPGLLAELSACASGTGVTKIEGDRDEGPVTYYFSSPEPGKERIDREVVFVKVGGQWHAEG